MILTNDFSLEPLTIEDASSLHHLMISNTERFGLYLPKTLAQNSTLEKSQSYISRKNQEHIDKAQFTFAIKEKLSNAIAGLIILKNIVNKIQQAEFAYGIGANYGGLGLTSKAVSKVIDFANRELKLNKFQIIVHKTNIGSVKVAVKNNFTWSETLTAKFTPKGQKPLDMELYELEI